MKIVSTSSPGETATFFVMEHVDRFFITWKPVKIFKKQWKQFYRENNPLSSQSEWDFEYHFYTHM